MRLLDARTFELRSFHDDAELPPYAILSHTWRADGEPELSDALELCKWSWTRTKTLYRKVSAAAHLARKDGLQWIWVDTCCIDRGNLVEAQEAVNASFRWYQGAEICYVYLEDLSSICPILSDRMLKGASQRNTRAQWMDSFANCTWFGRGWTLSELLASRRIRFYNNVWRPIGTKAMLARVIARITGIDAAIIRQRRALSSVSVAARLSWAAKRKTRRVEDQAYCLLGIFGISMPILYGEGPRAFQRLQEELINTFGDLSIFAWSCSGTGHGLLAESPDNFAECGDVISNGTGAACEIRNGRMKATLPIIQQKGGVGDVVTAVLGCRYAADVEHGLALRLRLCPGSQCLFFVANGLFEAKELNGRLSRVDIGMLKSAEVRTVELVDKRDLRLSSGVKCLVKTEPAMTIVSGQPAELWSARAKVLLPSGEPRIRALFQMRLPSGRDLVLEAGYDEFVIVKESSQTFTKHHIPGLRVVFVGRGWNGQRPSWTGNSPYWYCEHTPECVDGSAVTKGCPHTPVIAELGTPGDPERATIKVVPEREMGEDVFVLKVFVHQGSKMKNHGYENPSGTGNTDQTNLSLYSPPRLGPPSYRRSTDTVADQEGLCPRVPLTATPQQILLSNPSGKLWKMYPEGLLEVAKKREPRPAAAPTRKVRPRKPQDNPDVRSHKHQSKSSTHLPRDAKTRRSTKAQKEGQQKEHVGMDEQSTIRQLGERQSRSDQMDARQFRVNQSGPKQSGREQSNVKRSEAKKSRLKQRADHQAELGQSGVRAANVKLPPSQMWLDMSSPLHILYR